MNGEEQGWVQLQKFNSTPTPKDSTPTPIPTPTPHQKFNSTPTPNSSTPIPITDLPLLRVDTEISVFPESSPDCLRFSENLRVSENI